MKKINYGRFEPLCTDEENEAKVIVLLKSSLEGFMNLNHVSCATNIFNSSLKTILDSKESKIREIKSYVLKFVVNNTSSTKNIEAFKTYTPKILIKFAETR